MYQQGGPTGSMCHRVHTTLSLLPTVCWSSEGHAFSSQVAMEMPQIRPKIDASSMGPPLIFTIPYPEIVVFCPKIGVRRPKMVFLAVFSHTNE